MSRILMSTVGRSVSGLRESFDGTTTKFHWMANAGLASHFANLL